MLSTIVDELPAIHYVIAQFGGPVRVARYETFGTEELAAAVIEALGGPQRRADGQSRRRRRGRDIEQAVDMAINLEWLASVYYHAIVAGTPKILSEADLDAVARAAPARCAPRAEAARA